jgi:hypothetical protein
MAQLDGVSRHDRDAAAGTRLTVVKTFCAVLAG